MSKPSKATGVSRIIDANVNRSKEGLRVCEEIARFILNNRRLTQKFKECRHNLNLVVEVLPVDIQQRESLKDIGKNIFANELKRSDYQDIFYANIQRVKESVRVLEEFSKLLNVKAALGFKEARYEIYELEKEASKALLAYRRTLLSKLHHSERSEESNAVEILRRFAPQNDKR